MRDNNIPYVQSIPYHPHYNGIELIWAQYKLMFRQEITDKKINETKFKVIEILKALRPYINDETIFKCGMNGWK